MSRRKNASEGAQFVRFFGPLLNALRKLGGSGTRAEVTDQIIEDMQLSDDQRTELLESGTPRVAKNIDWARFYLCREGLIDSSRRGVWSLTDKGRTKHLTDEDARAVFLRWVRIYAERRKQRHEERSSVLQGVPESLDELQTETHSDQLLRILKDLPPSGFERLCQRLLREAGFAQVTVTGRSGDGGIDGHGVLQINPFVSFQVLFQCKRYDKSVSSSHVRDFRGAMLGRADKGIIITTGTFTADARREAMRDGAPPIELVDGQKLVEMFENLELGLRPRVVYEIDEAFFAEFSA